MNQPKQKQPGVVTKSHLLTGDKHIQMYDEKISKKRQEGEAKPKKERWAWAEVSRKNKAVESGQETYVEREEAEFEHMVEREIGGIYHQKNHPQKKK